MLESGSANSRRFSRTARRLRRSSFGVLPPSDPNKPMVHKPELALKRWRERKVVGRRTHQHGRTKRSPADRGTGRVRETVPAATQINTASRHSATAAR